MNYQKIHDAIILRALNRNLSENSSCESHHIHPKCEGGQNNGPVVKLTQKEHIIVHHLRYKITKVIGNLCAYNLMKYGRLFKNEYQTIISRAGGIAHHLQWKLRDPITYSERQRKSGKLAGAYSRDNKRGFHSLSEEQKKEARDKGRKTTVELKLGMFSDGYRKKHRLTLHKKVVTPAGVFDSMQEAAKHHNVVPGTITYRVNSISNVWCDWHYYGE